MMNMYVKAISELDMTLHTTGIIICSFTIYFCIKSTEREKG